MRNSFLLTLLLLAVASPAQGQGVADVMAGLRAGGGWVGIPIENGRGTFSTVTVPTAMLELAGCVNVWYGHSGTWEIAARENGNGGTLQITAEPGVGVPFRHDFGLKAQVDVDFRWSEPRDTTLMLWVGLDLMGETGEDACEPRYAGSD